MVDEVTQRVLASAQDFFAQQSRMSQYRTDPVLFARDVLGIEPWSKQRDIMQAVQDYNHVAVRSCHGSGKSFVASIIACWWLATRPVNDSIVVTTAPTYAQIHAILWEDIRKHMQTAKDRYEKGLSPMKLPGYITQGDQWKTDTGTLIGFGRKPADGNMHAFNGIHRRHVLVIVDESCGVREELFTAIEAITTTEGSRILAIGNPDDPATPFRKFFDLDVWHTLSVSSFDSPNFTRLHQGHWDYCPLEDPNCLKREWAKRWTRDSDINPDTLPLLPNKEWVEERRLAWGEESPLWKSKVLGEFSEQSLNTLFSLETLNRGRDATITPNRSDPVILGVDLSRFGPDYSAVYVNSGGQVRLLDSWGGKADEGSVDGMESAARVDALARQVGATEVRVDAEGIGGPILDQINRLSDGGYRVVAMRGSSVSPDNRRWINARAYWYDNVRQQMFQEKIDADMKDEKLFEELEQIQYHFKNRAAALQIESKDEMRKRGLKSPDFADAAVYACADLSYLDNSIFGHFEPGQRISMTAGEFLQIGATEGWISPL